MRRGARGAREARAALRPAALGIAVVVHFGGALLPCFAAPKAPPTTVPNDLFPAGTGLEGLAAKVHLDLEPATADKAVCHELLSKLSNSGDALLASRWLHKMRKSGVNLGPESYEVVVAAHCAQGLVFEGEMIFQVHAKELAPDGGHPSLSSYGHLAEAQQVFTAFAERGDVKKAQEYLTALKSLEAPVEMQTYAAVIESLAQRGHSDAARRWLEDALRAGLKPSQQCFSAAISAFAKESRLAEAEGVLKAMRAAKVEADVQTWGWLLVASIPSRAKRKPSNSSPEDLFREMLKAGIVPDSFALRALGKAIGLDRREELCKELAVDLSVVPGRSTRKDKKSKDHLVEPLRIVEDVDVYLLNEDHRYWPGSGLFKPEKDFGPRREKRHMKDEA